MTHCPGRGPGGSCCASPLQMTQHRMDAVFLTVSVAGVPMLGAQRVSVTAHG